MHIRARAGGGSGAGFQLYCTQQTKDDQPIAESQKTISSMQTSLKEDGEAQREMVIEQRKEPYEGNSNVIDEPITMHLSAGGGGGGGMDVWTRKGNARI